MRKTYASADIEVTFDPRRCIHAEECVRGAPEVFDPKARPWIQPEKAAGEKIAEVVARCPTGALHYARKDGGPPEQVPTEVTITFGKDGPIYVRGPMPVVDAAGERWPDAGHRYALCRCGGSANKPYCDNTHRKVGFQG